MLLGTMVEVAYGFDAKATAPMAWISRNALTKPRMRETSVPEASIALARPTLATLGVLGCSWSFGCVRCLGRVRCAWGLFGVVLLALIAPAQDVAHDSESEEQHEQDAEDQRAD